MRHSITVVGVTALALLALASPGCMGTKVTAPPGSDEAKLEGKWEYSHQDGDWKSVQILDLSYRRSGDAQPALTGTLSVNCVPSGASKTIVDAIEQNVEGAQFGTAPSVIFLPNFAVSGGKAEGSKPNPLRRSLIEIYKIRMDDNDPDVIYFISGAKSGDEESFAKELKMTRKK
jgi:hypothetical protein